MTDSAARPDAWTEQLFDLSANFVGNALPAGYRAAICADRQLTQSSDSRYVP